MKRLSDRQCLTLAGLTALLLIGFHAAFKKPLDSDEIEMLRSQFATQGQYLNQYAPPFQITRLDGTTFKLTEALGNNVVVLNFFATWCAPCREEMDELMHFIESTAEEPVVFLAISVGEKSEQVAAFLADESIHLPVAVDSEQAVAGKYRVEALPTTVVIYPNGSIRQYTTGAIANADVSLLPIVRAGSEVLRNQSDGVSIDPYIRGVEAQLPPPAGAENEPGLDAEPRFEPPGEPEEKL